MTDNRMALLEMAEKAGETDFLRDLVREAVQEFLEAEVDGRCGAGRHERSEARADQRNGYRAPVGHAGGLAGAVDPAAAPCELPAVVSRAPAGDREQALTAVVQEASIQGVSTRSVDALVLAAGMTGISS